MTSHLPIEQIEHLRGWLVDGAEDGPAGPGERGNLSNDVLCHKRVQTAANNFANEPHDLFK